MVFASPVFLFLFLPVMLLVYRVAPKLLRNIVLLIASLMFYTWGEAGYLGLILSAILFNWVVGLAIARLAGTARRRLWLAIGISGDIGILIYFKYANFAVENANLIAHWLGHGSWAIPGILLPLGISFFTFHAISYLVDVYRGSARAEPSLFNYALYILLFPQLIAGPIIRWKHIYSQFQNRHESLADFRWGVSRFIVGLAKKMLIANPLGQVADQIFNSPAHQLSASVAWLGIVCYTLQIYFDFSGYSDMAIGLMRMFGFRILENFNYPYISRSIREFWRRWHISLSTWFRDYVYIPLGGSQGSMARTCLNILVVFLLSGLWHGANWTFVLWGAWHGLCICLETAFVGRALDRAGPLSHIYGLAAIMLGWVLFRSPTIDYAMGYYAALFGMAHPAQTGLGLFDYLDNEVLALLVVGCVGSAPVMSYLNALLAARCAGSRGLTAAVNGCQLLALSGLFVLSASAVAAGSYNPFIYFRF